MIPGQFIRIVEIGTNIGHRNHLATMAALLAADAHGISRDPEQWGRRRNGRMIIRIALNRGIVCNVGKVARNETTKGLVIAILVWMEPFDEEVRFLMRSGW